MFDVWRKMVLALRVLSEAETIRKDRIPERCAAVDPVHNDYMNNIWGKR